LLLPVLNETFSVNPGRIFGSVADTVDLKNSMSLLAQPFDSNNPPSIKLALTA
jgi:hypothetical protein